jgi:2-hydroxychromene-2-carboxylate isomerase
MSPAKIRDGGYNRCFVQRLHNRQGDSMGRTVDYYFAPQSPWAYLGHQRLADIVQRTGATVHVMPIDLGGKVFPSSGGLPLGQRAPQRQAYRLVELQRFSQWLNAPLNLKPKYFPVGGDCGRPGSRCSGCHGDGGRDFGSLLGPRAQHGR